MIAKKFLLKLVLPIVLSGCPNTTPLDRVAILENGITTGETLFIGYTHLPDCDNSPPPACSDDELIAKIGKLDQQAFEAKETYRNAVVAGQADNILKELYLAATTALSKFTEATAPLAPIVNQ